MDNSIAGALRERLRHCLELCRQIAGPDNHTHSLPGRRFSESYTSFSPRSVASSNVVDSPSTRSQTGSPYIAKDQIRLHKALCSKATMRAQYLLPILETLSLADASSSLISNERACSIILRLEEELQDLQGLLLACSKRDSIGSLLSNKKKVLGDRLEASLQELRQCHTECLILLGTGSSQNGSGTASHYPDPDSLPESPMVDRSPQTMEIMLNGISNERSANNNTRLFKKSASDIGVRSSQLSSTSSVVSFFRRQQRPENGAGVGTSAPILNPEGTGSGAQRPQQTGPPPQLQNDVTTQQTASLGTSQRTETEQASYIQSGQGYSRGLGMRGSDAQLGVRRFVYMLTYGSQAEKCAALSSLSGIAASSDSGKLQVAAAGAIPPLSVMLALDSEPMRLAAAGVLLHLCWLDENRIVMAKAGCVPSLVSLLRSGNPETRTVAARVLWNLAINVDNKVIIGSSDAIPSLVAIIQSDSEAEAKREAAEALVQLAANNSANQKAVAEAGAIPPLVNMLRDGTPSEQDKAAFALGMLAVNNDENKLNISGSGAAPLLLDLLQTSQEDAARSAAWTLYVLSSHKISATYITASRGIEIVRTAMETAPPEAQYWSGYILSLLSPGSVVPTRPAASARYSSVTNARQDEDDEGMARQRREDRERMFSR